MGRESPDYYEPLLSPQSDVYLSFEKHSRQVKGWMILTLLLVVLLQFVALVVLLILLFTTHRRGVPFPVLYSPAQDVVKYELRNFNLPVTDADKKSRVNIYTQPPSPEVDAAWTSLYNFGITKLSKEQAVQLPNKTIPIQNDPGYYLTTLDVFHQLHCLNSLRQILNVDYYPSSVLNTTQKAEHAHHCIDSIRQSLMCSADISPIVWNWDEESSKSLPNFDVVHVCKNFDQLREWAGVRRAKEFDTHVYPGEAVGGSL